MTKPHAPTYDAIIVGARSAGSPTAMLLARLGRRVLVLERATFPSDVLSGHTIQPAGMARLAGWGLLDRVRAAGAPLVNRIRFDFGEVVLDGSPTAVDGIDAAVCIRRTVIDPLLAQAAAEAGAEVRFGTSVTELVFEQDRVVGVRGHDARGARFEARARVIVGADGVNSFVARRVDAPANALAPTTTACVYSYWSGLDLDHLELFSRPGRFLIAAPTNDGLTYVAQQVPIGESGRYRGGRIETAFTEALEVAPRLRDMVAGGARAERFRFAPTPDGYLRRSHGPGWALVGDAGCHKDPITAQGMYDAFRDAETLAGAIDTGLHGSPTDLDEALAAYETARDAAVLPMFELTCALADLDEPPTAEMRQLLGAMQGRPAAIARFLGVIAGSVTVTDFFGPASIASITGGLAA